MSAWGGLSGTPETVRIAHLEATITRLTADNKALTAEVERQVDLRDHQCKLKLSAFDRVEAAEAKLAKVEALWHETSEQAVANFDNWLETISDRDRLSAELAEALKRLEAIRDYPKEGDSRRTEDGYPLEIVYDEFAYKRMVDSYREVAVSFLASKEASQ
ncbi:hypothetical protein [Mesorhizobium sp. A556]